MWFLNSFCLILLSFSPLLEGLSKQFVIKQDYPRLLNAPLAIILLCTLHWSNNHVFSHVTIQGVRNGHHRELRHPLHKYAMHLRYSSQSKEFCSSKLRFMGAVPFSDGGVNLWIIHCDFSSLSLWILMSHSLTSLLCPIEGIMESCWASRTGKAKRAK